MRKVGLIALLSANFLMAGADRSCYRGFSGSVNDLNWAKKLLQARKGINFLIADEVPKDFRPAISLGLDIWNMALGYQIFRSQDMNNSFPLYEENLPNGQSTIYGGVFQGGDSLHYVRWFPQPTWYCVAVAGDLGDIRFNSLSVGNLNPNNIEDVARVVATTIHEAGHVLGYDHTDDAPPNPIVYESVMARYGSASYRSPIIKYLLGIKTGESGLISLFNDFDQELALCESRSGTYFEPDINKRPIHAIWNYRYNGIPFAITWGLLNADWYPYFQNKTWE